MAVFRNDPDQYFDIFLAPILFYSLVLDHPKLTNSFTSKRGSLSVWWSLSDLDPLKGWLVLFRNAPEYLLGSVGRPCLPGCQWTKVSFFSFDAGMKFTQNQDFFYSFCPIDFFPNFLILLSLNFEEYGSHQLQSYAIRGPKDFQNLLHNFTHQYATYQQSKVL